MSEALRQLRWFLAEQLFGWAFNLIKHEMSDQTAEAMLQLFMAMAEEPIFKPYFEDGP